MTAGTPLLSVENLSVEYSGIPAVHGISFDALPGEIVAIVGANGAGKTSTLRAISGLVSWGGNMLYQGEPLRGLDVHEIVQRGIAHVPEGRAVFGGLTVLENLRLASWVCTNRNAFEQAMERAFTLFPRLKDRRQQLAGTMSGGEQQMLALSRALIASPKVLLLDEPSMGLAPLVVRDIFEVLVEINRAGTTIVLIEQNAIQGLKIASRAHVLENGAIVLSGNGPELMRDARVKAAYLGG
ncbi:MAG TPA: ABC transporter ATP-binding protein [Candidatus Limnocylindrales bacterium]|nr:ABC transporter ATP-binding protein [Candidatus Limnocylindrales bacterium]